MRLQRELEKRGLHVQTFERNSYQFRVNGVFDYWVSLKQRTYAWHDLLTNERGYLSRGQAMDFIVSRVRNRAPDISKSEFIENLTKIGWGWLEAEKAWEERQGTTGIKHDGT